MPYTKEILEPLVASSVSVREVLRKLGKALEGGVHSHLAKRLRELEIDTSHFLGRRANSGAGHHGGPDKLSWREVLVNDRLGGVREKTARLRRALIESGVAHRCVCGQVPSWKGKSLCLQVEHKNGYPLDNRRANLCFLCPNCHSQTSTFGSKNR